MEMNGAIVEENKTKTVKVKSKYYDKKILILTAIMVLIFIGGVITGMYISYNHNVAEPYKLGQESILNKYSCYETPYAVPNIINTSYDKIK